MPRPFLSSIDNKLQKQNLNSFSKVVFILHDQLNLSAWPDWISEEKPLLVFMESREKGEEIPHHKIKATFVLSSMRHFALECADQGFPVLYHSTNKHFDGGIAELTQGFNGTLYFMTPSEWDTRERLRSIEADNFQIEELPNNIGDGDGEE